MIKGSEYSKTNHCFVSRRIIHQLKGNGNMGGCVRRVKSLDKISYSFMHTGEKKIPRVYGMIIGNLVSLMISV